MKIIGHISTAFKTKFGLPRQSGLVEEIRGVIEFEKEYRVCEAFRGLEDFSHIWLLWEFSGAKRDGWSPTVRPPLLGGNKRMGVFATRSPFRPNNIGISAVRLERIEFDKEKGPLLFVSGVDLANGTPIYDIKPYLPYADIIPQATGGFTDNLAERKIEVDFKEELLEKIPKEKRAELLSALSLDPRPSYLEDESRVFGFEFDNFEVRFTVSGNILKVIEVK